MISISNCEYVDSLTFPPLKCCKNAFHEHIDQTSQDSTLPETNSEFTPENGWLEDDVSVWEGQISGTMLVSGRILQQKHQT